MTKEDAQILTEFLTEISLEMITKVPKGASGETAKKFKVAIEGNKAILYGPSYIQALATGRGPTKKGQGSGETLKQRIRRWLDHRGIQPSPDPITGRVISKDSLAFLIARKIHRAGTKQFLQGRDSGILSDVLKPQRFNSLFDSLFDNKVNEIFSPIESVFNSIDQ
jgi:hypothetical protein